MKHQWICDDCGYDVEFRQPELPGDDRRSEQNEDRLCPRCGEEMYFDEIPEAGILITPTDEDNDSQGE